MKERTLQVLSALIQDFVITATPVASNKLLQNHNIKVSSATIRNEFAKLEEIGLIHSPHVSAGKVPTEKGYRFYVDQMLQDERAEAQVQEALQKHITQYKLNKRKESVFDTIQLLARLSGNIGFATINDDRTFYIGLSNVLRSPEFMAQPEEGAQIVEVFEGRERFQQIIESLNVPEQQTKIFIGEENLIEEMTSCSVIVHKFTHDDIQGYIGILGPMRMRYAFNKALIENLVEMI